MKWFHDKRKRMGISVLAGMLAAIILSGALQYDPEQKILAWWGVMYPEFCFAEKQTEHTDEKDKEKQPRVKVSFWLAKALDW